MRTKISDSICSALRKANILFSEAHSNRLVIFQFDTLGEQMEFNVRILCDDSEGLMSVFVSCPLRIPKDKMDMMCRWVNHQNKLLIFGNFFLRTSGGALVFISSQMLDGAGEQEVSFVIASAVNTFDRIYPEIMRMVRRSGGRRMAEDRRKIS